MTEYTAYRSKSVYLIMQIISVLYTLCKYPQQVDKLKMFILPFLFYAYFMGLRETFRENLIFYRKQAGLTQEQLSEKCDLNINYIASMECASSRFPKPETIDTIASVLNIRPSDLFMDKGCPKTTVTFESEKFTREVINELTQNLTREMTNYFEYKLN